MAKPSTPPDPEPVPTPTPTPLRFTKYTGISPDNFVRYDCTDPQAANQIAISSSCDLAGFNELELKAVQVTVEPPPK